MQIRVDALIDHANRSPAHAVFNPPGHPAWETCRSPGRNYWRAVASASLSFRIFPLCVFKPRTPRWLRGKLISAGRAGLESLIDKRLRPSPPLPRETRRRHAPSWRRDFHYLYPLPATKGGHVWRKAVDTRPEAALPVGWPRSVSRRSIVQRSRRLQTNTGLPDSVFDWQCSRIWSSFFAEIQFGR